MQQARRPPGAAAAPGRTTEHPLRLAITLLALAACSSTLSDSGPVAFERTEIEVGGSPYGLLAGDVTAADLDGDGRPDLATANYGAGTVTVLLTRPSDEGGGR